jgi:hypothetical protein
MDRRTFLRAGAVAATGVAGCLGSLEGRIRGHGRGPEQSGGEATDNTASYSLPVPREELEYGASRDAIPAIVEPRFAPDWSDLETAVRPYDVEFYSRPRLHDTDLVIGLVREGEARAYPLSILRWHEVVNDHFGGPILVTFCPLCGSGVSTSREVRGKSTVFGVSGLLWRSDLVMYDRRTESLWSQLIATAIRGPETGTELGFLPSSLTTWGEWRDAHPDTGILLPPPISDTVVGRTTRAYNRNPYALVYDSSRQIGIGQEAFTDERLHPKEVVLGVRHDGVSRAYPLSVVKRRGVVNDEVAGLPVVLAVGPRDTVFGFVRRIEGRVLRFSTGDERHLLAGGSRWRVSTGLAVDGPFEGTRLRRANDRTPMFWFAWLDFYPETDVFGQGSTVRD